MWEKAFCCRLVRKNEYQKCKYSSCWVFTYGSRNNRTFTFYWMMPVGLNILKIVQAIDSTRHKGECDKSNNSRQPCMTALPATA